MANEGDHAIELDNEELEERKKFLISLGFKAGITTVCYPLAFAKVLFQLGHEPYPTKLGKSFVYFGQEARYLPNVIAYLRNIYRDYGILALYRGIEANLISNTAGALASFGATKYMNRFYPNVGGSVDKLIDKAEGELSNHESLRVKIRQGVRDSIALTIGTVVSRPFTVIMVREIAQHIGGEMKYPNVWHSFWRIGLEEGLPGYFSGLIPDLIAGYLTIWGVAAIRYGAERFLENTYDKDDEVAVNTVKDVRFALQYAIPFIVGTISYPFNVVSTIMAVNGSGLAISLLPYSPVFGHWTDAYHYLEPKGLTRGSRMWWREHSSAVSVKTVGNKHQVYASNKHFL